MKKADWKDAFAKKTIGVEDMTILSIVSNDSIQKNLLLRFQNGLIYTYIGHVLISVNPFRDLGIYTDNHVAEYQGKARIEKEPHVFAIAEESYKKMCDYQKSQSVIISGESGAGKTEAAKKFLFYITKVCEETTATHQVKEKILATNPLLESFGNAKTIRNNNSSRFGKYLELMFDEQNRPVGASTTNYLLEKARVVRQQRGERNFHIFYQLCAGATNEMREAFGIYQAKDYYYTNQGNAVELMGTNDYQDFQETLNAMHVFGMSNDEIFIVFRLLASILWMGNLNFLDDRDQSYIENTDVLNMVAYLLEIDAQSLNHALTSRFMQTQRGKGGETYNIPLNRVQACAARDALAKSIYDRLFDWIVQKTNQALKSKTVVQNHTIGILDIYGFEIFEKNSFEQLCINYVNEKLQQIFVELTLKSEQEEYVRENIQWTPIQFFNNKIVCDLIEERRPPGVFPILNDVNSTAHAEDDGADRSLSQRLASCNSNPHFQLRGNAFCIKHYAGDVTYEISGMPEKNKDQLNLDLLQLLKSSQCGFITNLFPENATVDDQKKVPSASGRIKSSADSLVKALMLTTPSYIRCIKPNENKSPNEFDSKRTDHQIKYLGLLENVRVRRAGFCFRQEYSKFLEHFFLLSPKTSYAGEYIFNGDARNGCIAILRDSNIHRDEWQLGNTKVFIKHPETLWALEHLRDRYWHNMAMRIQRAYRNYIRYKTECARRIQIQYRAWRSKRAYIQLRDYGHSVYSQKKERRRFSLLSMRRFMGDYLVASDNYEILGTCPGVIKSRIMFSANCEVLVERFLRSPILEPREIVLSDTTLYVIKTVQKNHHKNKHLDRMISVQQIRRVSSSPYCDDFLVLHIAGEADLVLTCLLKTEFFTHLQCIHNGTLSYSNYERLEYEKKPSKVTILHFGSDAMLRNEEYILKGRKVKVGRGHDRYSVSFPPCRRYERAAKPITSGKLLKSKKQPPPPPPPLKKKYYKAEYSYVSQRQDELSFETNDIFEYIEEDENQWFKVRHVSTNHIGWVPSNYLSETVAITEANVPQASRGFNNPKVSYIAKKNEQQNHQNIPKLTINTNPPVAPKPQQPQMNLQKPIQSQVHLQKPVQSQVHLQKPVQSQVHLQKPVQSQVHLQKPVQSMSPYYSKSNYSQPVNQSHLSNNPSPKPTPYSSHQSSQLNSKYPAHPSYVSQNTRQPTQNPYSPKYQQFPSSTIKPSTYTPPSPSGSIAARAAALGGVPMFPMASPR